MNIKNIGHDLNEGDRKGTTVEQKKPQPLQFLNLENLFWIIFLENCETLKKHHIH